MHEATGLVVENILNLFVYYEFRDAAELAYRNRSKRMTPKEYMAPITYNHTLSPRRRRRWQRHHRRFSAKTNLISSARTCSTYLTNTTSFHYICIHYYSQCAMWHNLFGFAQCQREMWEIGVMICMWYMLYTQHFIGYNSAKARFWSKIQLGKFYNLQ